MNDVLKQCGDAKMKIAECVASVRKPKPYPLAIAAAANGTAIDFTQIRVRLTAEGGSFTRMPPDGRDAKDGSLILWQFHPSAFDAAMPSVTMDDVRAGIDVRLRVTTKKDGSKGCPIVKFRKPGDRWEFYDSNKGSWQEVPDPSTASFTAIQILAQFGLVPLSCI